MEASDSMNIHINRNLSKTILSKIISSAIRKKIKNTTVKIIELDISTLEDGTLHGNVNVAFDTDMKSIMEALDQ